MNLYVVDFFPFSFSLLFGNVTFPCALLHDDDPHQRGDHVQCSSQILLPNFLFFLFVGLVLATNQPTSHSNCLVWLVWLATMTRAKSSQTNR